MMHDDSCVVMHDGSSAKAGLNGRQGIQWVMKCAVFHSFLCCFFAVA